MRRFIFTIIFSALLSGYMAAQTTPRGVDVAVFPNPATEFIGLQTNNDAVGSLSVMTLLGVKARTFTYTPGEKYSIADLPNGTYLVQVFDKTGGVLATRRISKR